MEIPFLLEGKKSLDKLNKSTIILIHYNIFLKKSQIYLPYVCLNIKEKPFCLFIFFLFLLFIYILTHTHFACYGFFSIYTLFFFFTTLILWQHLFLFLHFTTLIKTSQILLYFSALQNLCRKNTNLIVSLIVLSFKQFFFFFLYS